MKTPDEFAKLVRSRKNIAVAREDIRERDAEWRRLVEEAQGERDRLQVEVIRLTRDSVEVNAYRRDEISAGNKACTERDRLKGELAEAEQLVRDAMGRPEWTGWYTRAQRYFAATPAEQAQLTAKRCTSCRHVSHAPGKCLPGCPCIDRPAAEQAQGEGAKCACADDPIGHHAQPCPLAQAYADGTPMDEKTALAWTKIKAQQTSVRYRRDPLAQVNARLDALDQRETDNAVLFSGQIAELNVQVAALAKRVDARFDALERHARGCDCAFGSKACPQGCGIACAACVAERVCRPATPPPEAAGPAFEFTGTCSVCGQLVSDGRVVHRECEAAGPGHVFLCKFAGSHPAGCGKSCLCDICDEMQWKCTGSPVHAVPPISGGGAR